MIQAGVQFTSQRILIYTDRIKNIICIAITVLGRILKISVVAYFILPYCDYT